MKKKNLSQKTILKRLKKLGVQITGKGAYIGEEVIVESGAKICSPCHITGATRICAGAQVSPYSYIENSHIGARTYVFSSTLRDSSVGEGCSVGPYAYLRNGSSVGDNCRVGDFVEIKNSSVGNGTKIAHLAYVGDAKLGERVNVGCGAVFANYDGKIKQCSVVEDECFIGCNCNIVAPVRIGKGAYVAAGTTLCGDLKGGDFCIGRCREKIIEGGAAGRYLNG